MDKAFARTQTPFPNLRKAAARAALVGFQDSTHSLLAECFRQYGIEPVSVIAEAAERMRREKFEACVVPLADWTGSGSILEAARNSRSNSRCVIYGVGGSAQDAMRYSRYGINAMFQEPLERPAMLKLVRATRLLVLHEFRRYVRIPAITDVSIVGDARRVSCTSIEISSGGMSLKTTEDFSTGAAVEISFALMTLSRVNLRGVVSWNKPKSLGIRFDPNDERRLKIKTWVDSYLRTDGVSGRLRDCSRPGARFRCVRRALEVVRKRRCAPANCVGASG